MLGNPPAAIQSPINNTANARARGAKIAVPGLAPGQYYPAGMLNSQGLGFGTPRDWSRGGMQYYDPQYVRPLNTETTSQTRVGGTSPSAPLLSASAYDTSGNRLPGTKPGGVAGQVGGAGVPQAASFGNLIGGSANVNTSITPQSIYPQWMTNSAVNQVQAQADQASNLPYLMKQFDRPGASRSSAHMAAALPQVAQAQVQATTGRAAIPFEDMLANQRNLFMGQVARENEALGWGNLAARMQEAQQSNYLNDMNRQYALLSALVG